MKAGEEFLLASVKNLAGSMPLHLCKDLLHLCVIFHMAAVQNGLGGGGGDGFVAMLGVVVGERLG